METLCDEVHALQNQVATQKKEPVICLMQSNVYVNYCSPVCWKETKGLRSKNTHALTEQIKTQLVSLSFFLTRRTSCLHHCRLGTETSWMVVCGLLVDKSTEIRRMPSCMGTGVDMFSLCKDLARTESRARAGLVDYPKIWTGHLKALSLTDVQRSQPY